MPRGLAFASGGGARVDPDPAEDRDGYVTVIDLGAGDRGARVPGLATGANSMALPVWTRDGRLLLVVPTDEHGAGRVAVWTPGAPRLTVLPVALSGFYCSPGEAVAVS